jgi:uncharacterized membrane-anchored protein
MPQLQIVEYVANFGKPVQKSYTPLRLWLTICLTAVVGQLETDPVPRAG